MDKLSLLTVLIGEFILKSPEFSGDLALAKEIGDTIGELQGLHLLKCEHGFDAPCIACVRAEEFRRSRG